MECANKDHEVLKTGQGNNKYVCDWQHEGRLRAGNVKEE